MSGANNRTLNVDSLFVRNIYFKDYANNPIPANQLLVSRGDGGTYFGNLPYSTNSTFYQAINEVDAPTADGGTYRLVASTSYNTLLLEPGAGMQFYSNSQTGGLIVYNTGPEQIVAGGQSLPFSTLTDELVGGRTLFFQGKNDINVYISDTTVVFDSISNTNLSTIVELQSTSIGLEQEFSTTNGYLNSSINTINVLFYSTNLFYLTSTLNAQYAIIGGLSTYFFVPNQINISTVSTTNLTINQNVIRDIALNNSIYDPCAVYANNTVISTNTDFLTFTDQFTNVTFAIDKEYLFASSTLKYGPSTTTVTKGQQVQLGWFPGISTQGSNTQSLRSQFVPVVQQMQVIEYIVSTNNVSTIGNYYLQNIGKFDKICSPSNLILAANNVYTSSIYLSTINGISVLANGTNYGDYLYWNGSSWAIGYSTIRIGDRAGSITQGEAAIAIGAAAGYLNQGSTSIAIGKYAGYSNQSTNTIVINATGSFLNTMFPNSLYIAPIRNDPTHSNTFLQYNPVTAEVIYNSSQIISATQANIVNLTASTINSAQLYALLNNGTNTWVKNTAISGLYYTYSAAMSATGQYQSMATQQYLSFPYGIFRSADFGNTWTLASGTSTNWGYIAISATGQYQLAGTNSIYVSNDFGVSFSIKNAASVSAGVAVSQSGQYMSVTNSTRAVYTSSDYGNTWQYITSVPGVSGTSYISLSATGQYQTATVQGGNGRVIISSNYGSTWTLISYPSYAVFYSIGLSQTGQYQTTGSYGGTIYISSDYGNTWAATSAPNNIWTSVAVSQSGQYQTAVVSNGGIYTSTDYGYSWTITSAPSKTWNSIAISQDNQYQLASYIDPGNGGGLYYLNNNNSALYISPIRNDTTQSNIFLQYNVSTNEVIYNANRIISMNQINTSSLTASTINTSVLTATQIVNLNASISSLTVSSINGLQGGLPAGSNYGDYLYYNGTRWVTGFSTISIGDKAGSITQGEAAVAIGAAAGQSNQSTGAVAIGQQAGQSTQQFWAVAVGYQAGQYAQSNQGIAMGFQAGQSNQGSECIAIGTTAGGINQTNVGIAIGSGAGKQNQNGGIAIGFESGLSNQSGIAIGNSAGCIIQSTSAIAIGNSAGYQNQMPNAIAIGFTAGRISQKDNSIAIGAFAGYSNQSPSSIAIGYAAGSNNQSNNSVAIGYSAGQSTQGAFGVAIGSSAGQITQGSNTVAIGNSAGKTNQGSNAVAIGYAAGSNNQSTNTIVINASGVTLNTSTANAFYVAPIRSDNTQRLPLAYNTVTKEIVTTSGNQLITDFVLPASVTSPAFGQTWILNRSAPVGVNWYGVAVSGTGQYQLGLVNGGSLYKSTDFGNTWAAVAGVSGTLYSAAISGTGQYQTVVQYPGFIYGSSDFGNTWAITNANNKNWAGVSISYTGQYQTVCDNTPGYIWYSLDYGVTWTQSSSPISYWTYVACSATGLYQTATSSSGIFTSADYGVTWTLAYTGALYWWTVALSQTGRYQLVVVQGNNVGSGLGYVYTSKDYGSTWTQATIPQYQYLGCAMSATGQYQVVCSGTNPYTAQTTTNTIYISTDYGSTWTLVANMPPGVSWYNVAMSGTAEYMTICTTNGGIYNSSSPVATGLTTSNVALGYYAGQSTQGAYGIAIGNAAGQFIQGISSIAIGVNAGQSNQLGSAVAIGVNAGQSNQLISAVAIGNSAGQSTQGASSVAIGDSAGQYAQGTNAVAIGNSAGYSNQGIQAVGVGISAGQFSQGAYATGVGVSAGYSNQGQRAVAVGINAGTTSQGQYAVAMGNQTGQFNQSTNAVAIGAFAGRSNQGSNAIAIGYAAGSNNQSTNTIVINATGVALNTTVSSSLYITPIRNDESVASGFLHYNSTTKEIVFNAQGGANGVKIYASTIYVSSITTNTASISSLTVSSINGLQGGGTTLSTGTTYGDYLYWNGTGWAVGTSNVVIGGGAGQTNQGNYGIAIGYSAGNINQGSNSVSIGYNSGNVNQGIFATAVGYSAGNTQATGAVAVGASAGNSNQQAYAVAVGYQAGILNQSTNAVAIGVNAGYLNQGSNAIAIGKSAGRTSQLQNTIILNATGTELNSANSNSLYIAPIRNDESVTAGFLHYNAATNEIVYNAQGGGGGGGGGSLPSTAVNRGDYLYWNGVAWVTGFSTISIGDLAGGDGAQANNAVAVGGAAGNYTQRSNAVAVGFAAGYSNQSAHSIAIGTYAAQYSQAISSIAIGANAGQSNQLGSAVAVGAFAGQRNQAASAVAIGGNAGQSNQLGSAVAIGVQAGQSTQGIYGIAIGNTAAQFSQATNTVAIGNSAGQSNQADSAIAIGFQTGQSTQGYFAVAIGRTAAQFSQGTNCVAIGQQSGNSNQGLLSLAIGAFSGRSNQGQYAVSVGGLAGQNTQGLGATAVGYAAALSSQGAYAVAVGNNAGNRNQGSNAIAIGYAAGYNNQSTNTIIINATGVVLNSAVSSSLYIDPIRNDESVTSGFLHYNSTTKEIVFNAQGGGGTLIYTSTLYASSVTTATASISSLVVSSINGPGSNGNFIYNANGLLAATSSVNILPIFQTSTVVFAQNTGSFNYLPTPANFTTNNGGVWTSSLIFANYASNFLPFPYFSAGQNTPGYYSYYTNGGQINALFSFKPSATVAGNPGQAAATVGFSTSLGYYTVGDYEITDGNRSTIIYNPSGSFVFGQPLEFYTTWQVQRTSNSLAFQYSTSVNNFSTVYTVNNINVYDTAQLYILNNNNYGTTLVGSWQVSALNQRQSFNVACAAQFSTLNTASASISSLSVSSIASVSLTGDIDMKLNNIKNIGSSEYSVPPFTFSIAPTSTITSGSYTYFVCNSSCTVSLGANLTNVVYFSLGGGAGGGSGYYNGGGGGAGGLQTNDPAIYSSLTLSSLQYNNNFLTLTNGQIYTITIGTGGGTNTNGTNTTFISGVSTFVTATGGGTGGGDVSVGISGGCGGGGTRTFGAGGIGSQGFNGGIGGNSPTTLGGQGGGGGGITSIGVNGTVANQGGAGGAGLTFLGITCGYGGQGGARAEYGGGATTGANATTPGSGGGGSADYITAGSGASGIFILGIPTAQIYNRRYGIISIDTNTNLVISTPTNIVLSGITGPNSNSPFVLTYNSTSGIVNYNTLPNTLVSTIAYGTAAGSIRQGDKAVAVGYYAGQSTQGANAIAIGNFAGLRYQSTNAVAIGAFAGQSSQGSNAVAIGYAAGSNNQSTNTIIINATGVALNSAISSSLYISPIRQNNSITTNALAYDTGTNEVVYNTTKTFVIDHPKDESKYLVHACLEGPEAGVYYRGTAVIADLETSVTITLPEYVDALATEFTVQVTPIYNGSVRTLNVSRISNNKFTVYGDSGEFDWHVYGRRLVLDVEPKKSSANVLGTGPYRWIA